MLPAFETVEEKAPFESFLPPGYKCTLAKACTLLVNRARQLNDAKAVVAGPFASLLELDPRWDATKMEELGMISDQSESDPVPEGQLIPPCTREELAEARLVLIRMTQQHYLPGITACLQEESLSAREDYPAEVLGPIFKLGLRLSEDGIIRSRGRTFLPDDRAKRRKELDPHLFTPDVAKELILIPGDGFLGECIMHTAHLATMHWGRNNMTAWTRSEYWVVNPSRIAAKVKRNCAVCTNYYAKPFTIPTHWIGLLLSEIRTEKEHGRGQRS
jgi:hypothetical protein